MPTNDLSKHSPVVRRAVVSAAIVVAALIAAIVVLGEQRSTVVTEVAGPVAAVATTEPVVDASATPFPPASGGATVVPAPTPAAVGGSNATPTPVPSTVPVPAPAPTGSPDPGPTATPLPDAPIDLILNPALTPAVSEAGPAVDGDAPRPVGRFVDDEGVASDLVLGELVVATDSLDALDGFLSRHNATVVTTTTSPSSAIVDYLVRVPVRVVDPAVAAANLDRAEPGHAGAYQLSDAAILTLIDIAATETADHGLEVSLNWIAISTTIPSGDVEEDPTLTNPFDAGYLREGGSFDTGVTSAWQLLSHHGRLGNTVEVLVADGGFFENPDFPAQSKIRLASWNEQNPGSCGAPCPRHGTDVAITAVGQVDNGWGVPGVAGPVGSLVAVQAHALDIFTEFRQIRDVVEQERPDVVNMSFGATIKVFRAASQASADRRVGEMVDTGAIVFAAAGNDGRNIDGEICVFGNCYENRLIVPCESKHAICVGGLRANGEGTWVHDGSNLGTAGGNRSVELYAPYCVNVPFNFSQAGGGIDQSCGTSFSSPFTAGVAALVLAADPSLDRHQVKQILMDTSHVGGVHFDHYISTGTQRRVNALDAVLDALNVEVGVPTVSISSPTDGEEITINDWIDLVGSAHDYKGEPLPISWTSSLDGAFDTSLAPVSVFELTSGTHAITAEVTDSNGVVRSASVTLVVTDNPPIMEISWPPPGTQVYEGTDITLVGGSLDPDTNAWLRDQDVQWELFRNGQLMTWAQGHTGEIDANQLTPGSYDIVFTGFELSGTKGTAESTLTVVALPPGQTVPEAEILTDLGEDPYGLYNGWAKSFQFDGMGWDAEDGSIPGTRMRWVAFADGHEQVLCEGTHFGAVSAPQPPPIDPGNGDDDDDDGGLVPPSIGGFVLAPQPPTIGNITAVPVDPDPTPNFPGPDSFAVGTDCSSFEVELGLLAHHPVVTHYTIVLEVKDSSGYVGIDQAALTVNYVTG